MVEKRNNTAINLKSYYLKKKKIWEARISGLNKLSKLVGWSRLVAFLLAFVLPFFVFELGSWLFFSFCFFFFVAFMLLVIFHNKLIRQKNYISYRIAYLHREIRIIDGDFQKEPDGEKYIDQDHEYVYDLDLFGKGSFFQFLNRTALRGGENKLAERIKKLSFDPLEIKNRQDAIKELSDFAGFKGHFYALGKVAEEKLKDRQPEIVVKDFEVNFISAFVKVFSIAFTVGSSFVILLTFLGVLPWVSLLLLFLVGGAISGVFVKRVMKVHSQVTELGQVLSRYGQLLVHFDSAKFEGSLLMQLQKRIRYNGQSAYVSLKKLSIAIDQFDQRLNMLMGVVLNAFFLWDIHCCHYLMIWKRKHGDQVESWFEVLYEVDALNTFASFRFNHPAYCVPQFDEINIIKAIAIGHPLIDASDRVSNNFQITADRRICIVTGANMAGKSTFLRTIGVSLVLASCGSVVAAEKFIYKPIPFITNMRAIDNLVKHESYFFSELKRLQFIMDQLKEKGELFFILDEILKGTNSYDKTTGSKELVKQLLKHNGCGLIATHDLELGQLAEDKPKSIFASCFEVTFAGDNLYFDYLLHPGVTQSHNASFLMQKMGLIPKRPANM